MTKTATKNKIVKKKVKENLTTMKELAKMLNCTKEAVRQKAQQVLPNKDFVEKKTTYFDEKEVSLMLASWKKNTSNNSSAKFNLSIKKTTTKELDKQEAIKGLKAIQKLDINNKIKACLYLNQNIIEELKQKNQILQDNNKRLETKQEAINLQNQVRVIIKQRWAVIDKYVKEVAKMRAENFKGFVKKNDYLKTYKYFYNEFSKMHNGVDKKEINKSFFVKYPRYMKELLEIIIADEGLKISDEELKMF